MYTTYIQYLSHLKRGQLLKGYKKDTNVTPSIIQ